MWNVVLLSIVSWLLEPERASYSLGSLLKMQIWGTDLILWLFRGGGGAGWESARA
jgi:hypothetical protein